jgi:hypothetical protein
MSKLPPKVLAGQLKETIHAGAEGWEMPVGSVELRVGWIRYWAERFGNSSG